MYSNLVFVLSLAEIVYPVAVVVLAVVASASLVLAPREHSCWLFFFVVIHNADASSSDIDPHVSGRSPQTSRICNGAYVATVVSTDQG